MYRIFYCTQIEGQMIVKDLLTSPDTTKSLGASHSLGLDRPTCWGIPCIWEFFPVGRTIGTREICFEKRVWHCVYWTMSTVFWKSHINMTWSKGPMHALVMYEMTPYLKHGIQYEPGPMAWKFLRINSTFHGMEFVFLVETDIKFPRRNDVLLEPLRCPEKLRKMESFSNLCLGGYQWKHHIDGYSGTLVTCYLCWYIQIHILHVHLLYTLFVYVHVP